MKELEEFIEKAYAKMQGKSNQQRGSNTQQEIQPGKQTGRSVPTPRINDGLIRDDCTLLTTKTKQRLEFDEESMNTASLGSILGSHKEPIDGDRYSRPRKGVDEAMVKL